MKRFIAHITVLCLIILAGQTLLSLDWQMSIPENSHSGIVRYLTGISVKIPDPGQYTPDKEIRAVQPYLETEPRIGFLWKKNVDSSANAKFTWGDQEPCMLSTDQWGFINSPEAIGELKTGRRVDMIGLGASFMQGAAAAFYDFYSLNDLFYYNMATHRHTLPMFNDVLQHYAIPLKPAWVLYELNEASPALIGDYLAWKRSGLDWFTYHSGTWSGPPKTSQYDLGPLKKIPSVNNLAIAVLKKVLPKKTASAETKVEQLQWCFNYICAADSMARQAGIRMIVLYIPAKETMFYGASRTSGLIEEILPMLEKRGIAVLDLRKPFIDTGDPRSLYYAVDGHWNKEGVLVAARALKAMIDFQSDIQHY